MPVEGSTSVRQWATAGVLNILATAALQAASFLGGVWTATVVGPIAFGALQLLRLAAEYCSFLPLGVPQAVMIELPAAHGRNDETAAAEALGILIRVLAAVVVIALALFLIPEALGMSVNGVSIPGQWALAGALAAASSAALLPRLALASRELFGRLAVHRLANAAVLATLTVLAVPALGIRGFLLALATGCGVEVLLWAFRPTDRVSWGWSWSKWKRYVAYGFSIKTAGFFRILVTSIDLWIVAWFLGPAAAGAYGFAVLLIRGYQFLPQMLHEMAFPRMAGLFGRAGHDPNLVLEPFIAYGRGLASTAACAAVLSFAVFSAAIDHWMPQFTASKVSFGVLLTGNYFAGAAAMCSGMLYMAERHKQMTAILAGALASAAILDLFAVYFIESVFAVASATSLCLIGQSLCVFFMTAALVKEPGRVWSLLGATAVRFVAVAAGLLAVGACGLTGPAWWGTGLSFLVAVVICVPLGLSAAKALKAFRTAREPGKKS